jgi:hypothetical protein
MLGSLLGNHGISQQTIFEGRKFKSTAEWVLLKMQEGSKDRYFQDVEDDVKKLVPEGIVGRVPYKGELNESMQQFIESSCRNGLLWFKRYSYFTGQRRTKTHKDTTTFLSR